MATVTNTIKLPGGITPTSAAVEIELVASTTTKAAGWVTATDVTILATYRPTVTNGAWTADLTPNADITPSGTVYRINEYANGKRYTHYISVGSGGGTVHDLLADEPGSLATAGSETFTTAAIATHAALTAGAHAATAITVADSAGAFSGTTVETVLAEIPSLIDAATQPHTPALPWASRSADDPATTYYVSTLTGNDSTGDGSSGAPYATIDKAVAIAAGSDCTILVRAPATSPLVDYTPISSAGSIVIDAWDYGEPWQHNGMATSTSGWTSAGGGVYSRTTSRTTVSAFVSSLTQTVGDRTFWLSLTQNTSTPTTPAAGQFGYQSNVLYVHLPGDADANSHTVLHPSTATNVAAIAYSGSGSLTVRNARFVAGNLEHITASSGTVVLESVDGIYSGTNGGFQSTSTNVMRCINCRAWRCGNDGFNVKNSSVVTLIDCDGSYNDDEGASPHETSTLTISGGVYRYNGSGGVTAVDSAVLNINRSPLFQLNHRLGANAGEGAITYYASTNSGRLLSARCLDNSGPGIVIKSGASVSRVDTDIVSGTANGNAQADNYAA